VRAGRRAGRKRCCFAVFLLNRGHLFGPDKEFTTCPSAQTKMTSVVVLKIRFGRLSLSCLPLTRCAAGMDGQEPYCCEGNGSLVAAARARYEPLRGGNTSAVSSPSPSLPPHCYLHYCSATATSRAAGSRGGAAGPRRAAPRVRRAQPLLLITALSPRLNGMTNCPAD
jgi:hypothetical protein